MCTNLHRIFTEASQKLLENFQITASSNQQHIEPCLFLSKRESFFTEQPRKNDFLGTVSSIDMPILAHFDFFTDQYQNSHRRLTKKFRISDSPSPSPKSNPALPRGAKKKEFRYF